MRPCFSAEAWADDLRWQEAADGTLERVNALIKETMRTPFKGIGKPEPLKGNLAGWWSRRITGTYRLVNRVTGSGAAPTLEIAQCRWHDED
ncbi:Txe/YoeB family addiction module toxin [Methylobacterium sp. JK268]